ncbi:flavodoxin domain-containing protein [Ruixingdingia sedimenti]|uniref:Flavodoxin domain-containing protein n=1 Tax=Ruixingdingia sedimenti TaxID=3073604 RepID=A0ABU1FCK6_9RHOB|nr:flavodoxin domain-containing protein [Xinfangfangia sp. LG-4]MDR5654204.1 flavodoxin domain-containing protein [Xinfangfangia sp. LG-4]
MNITVLYGTETGNAEMLAEDVVAHLGAGHDVACTNLSDFAPGDFTPDRFYLVICSTYGDGELPASAKPFAAAMEAERPDLSGIHFAIFGLGDTEYDTTHNFGSRIIADLLTGQGATQVGPRVTHDASGSEMAEDLAMDWADAAVALARDRIGEAA